MPTLIDYRGRYADAPVEMLTHDNLMWAIDQEMHFPLIKTFCREELLLIPKETWSFPMMQQLVGWSGNPDWTPQSRPAHPSAASGIVTALVAMKAVNRLENVTDDPEGFAKHLYEPIALAVKAKALSGDDLSPKLRTSILNHARRLTEDLKQHSKTMDGDALQETIAKARAARQLATTIAQSVIAAPQILTPK